MLILGFFSRENRQRIETYFAFDFANDSSCNAFDNNNKYIKQIEIEQNNDCLPGMPQTGTFDKSQNRKDRRKKQR